MTVAAPPSMLDAALAWHDAGCSVVRVCVDGSKAPLGSWKPYQTERASRDLVRAWYLGGHPGLGVVCGRISGGLEMLEIEGRAMVDGTVDRFLATLDAHALDIKDRLLNGYTELSPSGGLHFLYRVDGGEIGGNTKLARRPGPADPETGRPTVDTLIETRGEGGFVIVAPSGGPVHPSGESWRAGSSTPAAMITLSPDERDTLHAVAMLCDEMPRPAPLPDPAPRESAEPGELTPGEDFNERGDWGTVLGEVGWTVVRRLGDATYWRRPGKRIGISAVTGGGGQDYLYVWSTSTELPAEEALSKFRAYAFMYHGGDFSAAASALRALGYGSPRPPATRPVFTVLPAPLDAEPAPAEDEPVTTPLDTEDANALTLVDQYGSRIRFVADRGRWLHWDGTRWDWCPPGGGIVREYAKHLGRCLEPVDTAGRNHQRHSLSARGTTGTLMQASTDPRITVQLDQLDARPLELNTPAGIVDLATGLIRPADPAALHTRITSVAPDPGADLGPWLAFLADTFAEYPELPGYVQRLIGYSVIGQIREHILPFAHGPGGNGKGVFLESVRAVLGDYATTAPARFLMAQTYSAHETELARLAGARMVICSEVNKGEKFDESRVKLLTGGDAITGRFMHQDHFTFSPTHQLWLMGNHKPEVNAGGYSFWRRLRLIPFTNEVPPEKVVEDLQGIFARDHGAAILHWIITGAVTYWTHGLDEPECVRVATEEYQHEQDTVARFLDECCRVGGGDQVKIRMDRVRTAYERWCLSEGATPVAGTTFGLTVRRLGIGATRSNGRKFYTNLALWDEDAEGGEQHG